MTDQERARALSGAKRGCLWVPTDIPAKEYERQAANLPHDAFCQGGCKGTGRVFILDDRARWECDCHGTPSYGSDDPLAHEFSASCTCCRDTCGGSGWLSTLVIEEPCRERHNIEVSSSRCKACGVWQTDPPGTIVRPDTDRIVAVLEAAGYQVAYWRVEREWSVRFGPRGIERFDPDILLAACQAGGVEVM